MKIILNEKQVEKLTNGWKEVGGKLQKKYKFDSYSEVMDFVNKVGKIAEKQNHHPDMVVKYDEVIVTIFDHEKNKISKKCHNFIKEIDKL